MNHRVFTEFEAYADSVRDADFRFTLPRLQLSYWSIRNFRVGSIHIQRVYEGGGSIAEGAIRRDGWGFFVQTYGAGGRGNGVRMQADSVFVMPPGTEFCLASENTHDWFSVYIPTTSLFPLNDEMAGTARAGRVVNPGLELTNRLRTAVDRFVLAAEMEPSVMSEPAALAAFRETLLVTTRQMLGVTAVSASPDRLIFNRRDLVAVAVELIEQSLYLSPTIQALVDESGVSERTLRSAFIDYFGVSPRKYLNLRRLHQARELLRNGDRDETAVSAVAAKFGFWDFGRFAEKYRRVFDELPSDTLHRKRIGT